jgi:hypothetical protein
MDDLVLEKTEKEEVKKRRHLSRLLSATRFQIKAYQNLQIYEVVIKEFKHVFYQFYCPSAFLDVS